MTILLVYKFLTLRISHRVLWSRPIPLAWYLRPQWQDKYGREWSAKMCENWIVRDRLLKNFAADV